MVLLIVPVVIVPFLTYQLSYPDHSSPPCLIVIHPQIAQRKPSHYVNKKSRRSFPIHALLPHARDLLFRREEAEDDEAEEDATTGTLCMGGDGAEYNIGVIQAAGMGTVDGLVSKAKVFNVSCSAT